MWNLKVERKDDEPLISYCESTQENLLSYLELIKLSIEDGDEILSVTITKD